LLLRLRDDDGTLVPAAAFLPAAERFDLMPTIDRWVVPTTFAALAGRYVTARTPARDMFSINLSGSTIGDDTFLEFVREGLSDHGVPPHVICFELTETVAITLDCLNTLGVDYAQGYAIGRPVPFADRLAQPAPCASTTAPRVRGAVHRRSRPSGWAVWRSRSVVKASDRVERREIPVTGWRSEDTRGGEFSGIAGIAGDCSAHRALLPIGTALWRHWVQLPFGNQSRGRPSGSAASSSVGFGPPPGARGHAAGFPPGRKVVVEWPRSRSWSTSGPSATATAA
jgi:hypothetical protein